MLKAMIYFLFLFSSSFLQSQETAPCAQNNLDVVEDGDWCLITKAQNQERPQIDLAPLLKLIPKLHTRRSQHPMAAAMKRYEKWLIVPFTQIDYQHMLKHGVCAAECLDLLNHQLQNTQSLSWPLTNTPQHQQDWLSVSERPEVKAVLPQLMQFWHQWQDTIDWRLNHESGKDSTILEKFMKDHHHDKLSFSQNSRSFLFLDHHSSAKEIFKQIDQHLDKYESEALLLLFKGVVVSSMQKEADGHAMAIIRVPGKGLLFLDPNIGLFLFPRFEDLLTTASDFFPQLYKNAFRGVQIIDVSSSR
jgi:hypothetical protein